MASFLLSLEGFSLEIVKIIMLWHRAFQIAGLAVPRFEHRTAWIAKLGDGVIQDSRSEGGCPKLFPQKLRDTPESIYSTWNLTPFCLMALR